jgi:hypothetical protein
MASTCPSAPHASPLGAPYAFTPMAHGTHDYEDDARNERILVWVNGDLVPRERAVVSARRPSATSRLTVNTTLGRGITIST